jgi:hypothetical protein
VDYLVQTQAEDGSWDEPWYTGTGFPGDFYINYHLYRLCFPVTALGRWLRAVRPGGEAPEVSSALSRPEQPGATPSSDSAAGPDRDEAAGGAMHDPTAGDAPSASAPRSDAPAESRESGTRPPAGRRRSARRRATKPTEAGS